MAKRISLVDEVIINKIYLIRDQKVMLDTDLAVLYGVPTKALNQAVKRNAQRFPKDFMFRLSAKEFDILRSHIVTSNSGGRRTSPYAFTEQGVAMLSSVLKSERGNPGQHPYYSDFYAYASDAANPEGCLINAGETGKKDRST